MPAHTTFNSSTSCDLETISSCNQTQLKTVEIMTYIFLNTDILTQANNYQVKDFRNIFTLQEIMALCRGREKCSTNIDCIVHDNFYLTLNLPKINS